ncbi:bifunctional [glutamate--ammonia ligase]-adenylyl-L-tyrosine phosphorylase/[glutamate--ammonia-ligase] adenylyltransferase [Rodentibacter caecimuris]|uniref:Bifunctional glutamine synthetase adenylyltransferase/adenylyl-removing enzyme n=1 Tax=Rodentibacter caecimuris TaxID=1796644 RepID=A0ABX3KXV9_9PAST|nr:bifunctional glutamine synthetase adenylyltransferase/deadenyltransferase [Rodentibacter heylii]
MNQISSQIEQKLHHLAQIIHQHFPEYSLEYLYLNIQQNQQDLSSTIGQLAYAIKLSEFVEKTLQNQPHFLLQCWNHFVYLPNENSYADKLNEEVKHIQDENELYRILRHFRDREMAVLSICQSLNIGTVEDIFRHLSILAENIIIVARDWLYSQACSEMGTPVDSQNNPQQLYILGMGKLGGFELNFSSDIDLIFTYPESGQTVGSKRSVDNQKFFTRLGQRLINALDQFTPDGFVYRTDMRLRPFGESGALALSFSALEQYYQDQGRDWERYAMIKGRILGANNLDPNVKILYNLLRPFIYRRYIDFSVIQSLRDMKGKIEREIKRRGLKDNIKLGAGGIREIEFIVQVFQLIRGGREICLQQQSLLCALPEISRLELIAPQQSENLRLAYLFLRRVENILQAINDQQTQQLPENQKDRKRLIEACRLFTIYDRQNSIQEIHYEIKNWEAFKVTLTKHQNAVRQIFDQFIGNESDEKEERSENWQDFLESNHEELVFILQHYSLPESKIDVIAKNLADFKQNLHRKIVGKRGHDVLKQLMPKIFNLIFSHQNYLVALPRILNIIEKIASRTTYLELLLEQPNVSKQLIELCTKSELIAEQVAKYPLLLDELLNTASLINPIPFTEYPSELQQYLLRIPPDDEEQFIDALRQFKQSILLRVAAADILGSLPVMKVSDHLTYLAETIINTVVNLAWKQVSSRFGTPEHLETNQTGFLVIGYGKLGGIELGYKSDLDLVFLYQSTLGQTKGGKKTIDSNQFYLRLAQKIVSIFSLNTSAGVLYEVDMRLRPSGDAGLLGCSLETFENYQLNEAWTWEKQALVRSRVVFGDIKLHQKFNQIRHKVLSTPRDLAQLKIDIREMREKMYRALSKSKENEFNIKTDRGGITDIEFIAQYLMLAYAPLHSALTMWSDNVRIFDDMASYQLISDNDCEKLKQCYVDLRNRIHHLNLIGQPSIVSDSEFDLERKFIQSYWQKLLG